MLKLLAYTFPTSLTNRLDLLFSKLFQRTPPSEERNLMNRTWQLILALVAAGACSGRAALAFTGSYSQSFDSLSSAEATGISWTDNSTLEGWYASQSSYTVNHGNSPSVGLYDFGSSGSSDRALGSITGSGATTIYYGIALKNNTGGILTAVQITYQGEQWRLGNGNVADTLTFQYLIGDPSENKVANGSWTTISALNFTSPQIGSSGTWLDGNAAVNSSPISFVVSGLSVANDTDVWFRWVDNDVAGNDAGLAVDNFSIQTIPESPMWGPFSGAALLAFCGFHLWRQYRLQALTTRRSR